MELMVMELDTSPRGMPSRRSFMSRMEQMETPTLPTSPTARGLSASWPIWVGRSKATERPVWPALRSAWYRWFDSLALPKPAYWRMVQWRPRYMVGCTPRVKGYSPGNPSFSRYWASEAASGVSTTSRTTLLEVRK